MYKFFNYFSALAIVIIASLSIASCSKDEPGTGSKSQLFGTWTYTSADDDGEYETYTLKLNSNYTGSITVNYTTRASLSFTENFNWTLSESSSGNKYIDMIHTGGDFVLMDEDDSSSSWVYIIAGDKLSFGGLAFTRVK